MSEITGSLKRDLKELLTESASLITGFFKRGACTVRAVADKWRAFARDISGAVDTLMKPPFAEGGPDAPAQNLDPESEPTVTIIDGTLGQYQPGQKLKLSTANRLVYRESLQSVKADTMTPALRVRIDYMKDGQPDCYTLPVDMSLGGDLLDHLSVWADHFRTDPEKVVRLFDSAPEQYREELRTQFMPVLRSSLDDLVTNVMHYLQTHCDISEMEQQFQLQAQAMPEQERRNFQAAAHSTITILRRGANEGRQLAAPIKQKQPDLRGPSISVPQERRTKQGPGQKSRGSVKDKLKRIEADRGGKGGPHKGPVKPKR